MKEYQKALQCEKEFFDAWIGEIPKEISLLFTDILEKAKEENILDINKVTKYGSSLLHLIIQNTNQDQTKAMSVLLGYGADINLREAGHRTPLHWAITRFSMDTERYNFVNFLIANGADVNKGDETGQTPLRYIIKLINYSSIHHSRSLLLPLLENGAKVFQQDNDGINPYDELEEKIEDFPKASEIEDLKNSMNVLKKFFNEEKKFATQCAIECEKIVNEKWKSTNPCNYHLRNIISEAKEEGVFDINWSGKTGYNLLHLAASRQEIDVIEFLLSKGADVNRQTRVKSKDMRAGYTAFHCILNSNEYLSLDTWEQRYFSSEQKLGVLLLLKYDARIDISDKDGCTILNAAIANQQHDNGFLLDLLIEGQRNPYQKQQLLALRTGEYQPPTLFNLSIFAVQKKLPKASFENIEDILPEKIYSRLIN